MEEQEKKADYKEIFERERAEWSEKIQVVSLHLKDIRTVAKAQVDLYSYRQNLLEYSFKLAGIISKLNSRYRNEKARKLREYSENTDVRYGANEKTVLIEGDLTQITEKVEIVEGNSKFMDQTVKTVDHMLYGVRQRIALEEYLRGTTVK